MALLQKVWPQTDVWTAMWVERNKPYKNWYYYNVVMWVERNKPFTIVNWYYYDEIVYSYVYGILEKLGFIVLSSNMNYMDAL